MNYQVFQFNRRSQSLTEVAEQIRKISGISVIKLTESPASGEVLIEILHEDETDPKANQRLEIFDIASMPSVVEAMAQSVRSLGKDQTIKAINLLPLGGSRALGLLLTETAVEVNSTNGPAKRKAPKAPNKGPTSFASSTKSSEDT